MTEKNKNYIGITLLVIPFVVTLFLVRELIEGLLGQTLGIIVSSLIGALVGFFFYHILRNLSVALRFSLLAVYILLLALGWNMTVKNTEARITPELENNVKKPTIQGDWLAREDGITLNVKINSDTIEMIYYPDTTKQLYTYKLMDNTIELNGVNLEDELIWEFAFLDSGDSMQVESEDFVFVLKRQ